MRRLAAIWLLLSWVAFALAPPRFEPLPRAHEPPTASIGGEAKAILATLERLPKPNVGRPTLLLSLLAEWRKASVAVIRGRRVFVTHDAFPNEWLRDQREAIRRACRRVAPASASDPVRA